MPEIKRTFTAGKMNKDLDERLVRNGEYRDALNIQVRTTDGDGEGIGNAGTVQNIEGNEVMASVYRTVGYNITNPKENSTRFIGCVGDEKNDKAYFFAAAPLPDTQQPILDIPMNDITHEVFWVDSILEVDLIPDIDPNAIPSTPVLTDFFAVTCPLGPHTVISPDTGEAETSPGVVDPDTLPSGGFNQLTVLDGSKYRVGMKVYLQNENGILKWKNLLKYLKVWVNKLSNYAGN